MGIVAVIYAIAKWGSAGILALLGILLVVAFLWGVSAAFFGWLIMLALGIFGLGTYGFGTCFLFGLIAAVVLG